MILTYEEARLLSYVTNYETREEQLANLTETYGNWDDLVGYVGSVERLESTLAGLSRKGLGEFSLDAGRFEFTEKGVHTIFDIWDAETESSGRKATREEIAAQFVLLGKAPAAEILVDALNWHAAEGGFKLWRDASNKLWCSDNIYEGAFGLLDFLYEYGGLPLLRKFKNSLRHQHLMEKHRACPVWGLVFEYWKPKKEHGDDG